MRFGLSLCSMLRARCFYIRVWDSEEFVIVKCVVFNLLVSQFVLVRGWMSLIDLKSCRSATSYALTPRVSITSRSDNKK